MMSDVTSDLVVIVAPRCSPWGAVQYLQKLAEGVYEVGTVGHGGVMVHQSVAPSLLSEAARKRGWAWSGWLAYEEDSDFALAIIELEAAWPVFYAHCPPERRTPEAIRASLIRTLSGWNAEYLLERGIAPDPEAYGHFQASREADRRRRERDPDLIVTAWGEWDTGRPGVVRVGTADGKNHLVTLASYRAAQERGGPLTLLSACVPAV